MTYYTPAPRNPKLPPVRINLLSDTQTRPTQGMREAITRADVGDEQIGDDPTVNLLCERVADLLGKEAAVFMPSGTMCNVAATLHMVPDGMNTAASLPSKSATRSHSKFTVGSSPICSSPTSARVIASRMPCVGRVWVSDSRLMRTGGSFGLRGAGV